MDRKDPQYSSRKVIPDDVRQKQQEWLMSQIPVVSNNESVILPTQFFKNLSNDQLQILLERVDLEIKIGKKTTQYIRRRLIAMGINPNDYFRDETGQNV